MHNNSTPSAPQKAPQQPPQRAASTVASNPFLIKSKYGDFSKIQASRPDFNRSLPIAVSKTPDPDWKYGNHVNDKSIQQLQHVEIDPYQPDRGMISNYRLLIAAIPRPISFVSTLSNEGKQNLAPFSYFQVVDHDPPILVIGFSARNGRPKDTQKNLVETGECVISVVSEHMIEGVNGTSLDVPHGVSEWGLSGFQSAPSSTVKPQRVKNAVFSIEGKLLEMKELDYGHQDDGKAHGALAIIQATRFWVREDALNDTHDDIDLGKMRPLVQLGGISYGRVRETFELPRPGLEAELKDESKGLRPFIEGKIRPQPGPDPSVLPYEEPAELAKAVA
jgi:flavin reductase (DIM6/NTAB) family NADH-FMN oxidoreductase RutF